MKVGTQPSASCARISRAPAVRDAGVAAEQLGVDQVHRADIERRRHRDPAAAGDEPLDEIEADLAVIQAAVDMGARAIDEVRRIEGLGKAAKQAHGERRRRSPVAG